MLEYSNIFAFIITCLVLSLTCGCSTIEPQPTSAVVITPRFTPLLTEIPVFIGGHPINAGEVLPVNSMRPSTASWISNDFRVTTNGKFFGNIEVTVKERPIPFLQGKDFLLVQVWAQYSDMPYAEGSIKKISALIPIVANNSQELSASFSSDGEFSVPPVMMDEASSSWKRLENIQITFIWVRVYTSNQGLWFVIYSNFLSGRNGDSNYSKITLDQQPVPIHNVFDSSGPLPEDFIKSLKGFDYIVWVKENIRW
jgi:hypothetical protein